MVIWIDGTYGVGKTEVAMRLKQRFLDSTVELLESDKYYNELMEKLLDEAAANKVFPCIGGTMPQNNMKFIKEFRELIIEKSRDENKMLIIDMALTMKECKENLIEYLEKQNTNLIHVILMADNETIRLRIKNDENRMKDFALDYLIENVLFLNDNFSNAIRVKTDNRSLDEIVDKIMERLDL